MARVPAKSRSRGLVRQHERRVLTRRGPRVVTVNRGVRPRRAPPRRSDHRPPVVRRESLPVKVRWEGVLRRDDTPLRGDFWRELTPQLVWNEIEAPFPTRNKDSFAREYVVEPFQKLREELRDMARRGEPVDALIRHRDEGVGEIAREATAILEDDEQEPVAVVRWSDGEEDRISTYYAPEKNVDVKYVRTGGWRGYYDLVPGDPWVVLHEDQELSMSRDAVDLREFGEALERRFDEEGVRYGRAGLRTSNVFASNVTWVVHKDDRALAERVRDELLKEYRDPLLREMETNPLFDTVRELRDRGLSREDVLSRVGGSNNETMRRAVELAFRGDG